MRIDSSLPVTTSAANAAADAGSKVGTSKVAAGETSGTDTTGGFNPTPDLTHLISLVKQVPEMRSEVIQDVMDRSAIGELTTRTAAVDTAAAMLDNQ